MKIHRLIILFIALNLFAISLFIFTVSESLISTILLFISVSGLGLFLCNRLSFSLKNKKILLLSELWLMKCFFTLILLYVGWIPELDPNISQNWGYDPQRYYQDSWNLILQNWDPETLVQNYQGIIYFYSVIFYLFGHNPVIPAIINSLITLLGTIFLIRSAFTLMPYRTRNDWSIIFLLIVPEVLWYDVMTSRENLNMVLLGMVILSFGNYVLGIGNKYRNLILIIILTLIIITIRTSIIFNILLSFVLIILLVKTNYKNRSKLVIIPVMTILLIIAPILQSITGSYDVNYFKLLDTIQTGNDILNHGEGWASNSIGALLVPDNFFESIFFVFPRGILYLVAPLPNISFTFIDLINGSYKAWQGLMTLLTSIFLILFFPFVLNATKLAWKTRKHTPSLIIIPIAFWSTFFSVSGGNIIIVERYRILFSLFFFLTAWIGYSRGNPSTNYKVFFFWFIFLFFSFFSYLAYKWNY